MARRLSRALFLGSTLLLGHSPSHICRAFAPARVSSHLPPFRLSKATTIRTTTLQHGVTTKKQISLSPIILSSTALATPSAAAWWYMGMLAVQFGAQPILTKTYTPKTICRSSVVLAQEIVKFLTAGMLLWCSGSWATSIQGWTIGSWWMVAGIPALLYVIQNYCSLTAYQNLPPVTFNVLNQTKTLSAALCCYWVMGRAQSKQQMVALCILLLAALVIEQVVPLPFGGHRAASRNQPQPEEPSTNDDDDTSRRRRRQTHILTGVIPVLVASFISGLAGALSQRTLQTVGRNSYMFTMELSAASSLFLVASLLGSPDGQKLSKEGIFVGWTAKTWIPVVTNAVGGVVVGLVTKYAGSVRKGFALIFGLLLSGILQSQLQSKNDGDGGVTPEQVVGGVLAALSLWMHAKFPYVAASM